MRRHELAVLRSLGFESRQLGSTLVWQASTIGLIGLTIGVPLGVIAGRFVWEAVTGGIGVVDAPVAPAVPILVVLIAALVVLNIAATVPSRRARKIAAAAVLSAGG
jgi:putative ABC transport system permease protein